MAKTQTFTAGFSSVGNFGYADRFTLYVKLTDRDGDSSTNQSTVDYEVYFENTSGGGTFTSKTRLAFYLNGEKITDSTLEITAPRNGKYWIASGSKTFTHDGDGSKTIGFQAIVSSIFSTRGAKSGRLLYRQRTRRRNHVLFIRRYGGALGGR